MLRTPLLEDFFYFRTLKRPAPEPLVTPVENFDFGEALTRVYPILDLIFEYLPFNDLKSCTKVSQLWRDKAEYVLSKRKAPSWFTCYKKTIRENNVSHSLNLNYNNADIGIIFYDSCQLKSKHSLHAKYNYKIGSCCCSDYNNSEINRTAPPDAYFEEELIPKSVKFCMFSVHRTVSYFNNERSCKDVEYRSSVFDGVFIPKIPSVRTVMFLCNPRKPAELEQTINLQVKAHEQTKCLLVFSKYKIRHHFYNLLERLIPKGPSGLIALGGGVIKSSKTVMQNDQRDKVKTVYQPVCIAFLKDKNSTLDNFNAYSCCINEPDLSKAEFALKLSNFKKNINLRRHGLAFRICCVAKYKESELEAFVEVFPDLPLAGLDAHGEFGWNCYPNASVTGSEENKDYPQVEHEYSTVIVIITWD